MVWPGPPPRGHRYSGLHFKIGRTTDVLKRLQNLRTGTSDDLIIDALEPGDALIEVERHRQFASDRRKGEWFAASPVLCRHVFETWKKYRILPPEHQRKVLSFVERSDIYSRLRTSGFKFDMINPSLNEPWFGSVFVDLVYTSLLRGGNDEKA
ncbi:MAG: GIY-YIG nuclease family protein [Limisphaerales bacterium]